MLLEQEIARRLALLGIADEHRHDVGVVHHHGRPAASSTALVRAAQLASLSVSSVRGRPIPRGRDRPPANPAWGRGGWEECRAPSTREVVYLAKQIGTQQGPSLPVK